MGARIPGGRERRGGLGGRRGGADAAGHGQPARSQLVATWLGGALERRAVAAVLAQRRWRIDVDPTAFSGIMEIQTKKVLNLHSRHANWLTRRKVYSLHGQHRAY